MKPTKQSTIEIFLLLGSVFCLIYILFMHYAYLQDWDHSWVIAVMEVIIIPIILLGCAIPLIIVFRFISKKTTNRTMAILTLFVSLLLALLLGYTSF